MRLQSEPLLFSFPTPSGSFVLLLPLLPLLASLLFVLSPCFRAFPLLLWLLPCCPFRFSHWASDLSVWVALCPLLQPKGEGVCDASITHNNSVP